MRGGSSTIGASGLRTEVSWHLPLRMERKIIISGGTRSGRLAGSPTGLPNLLTLLGDWH